jgi:hypothetical protein
MPIALDIQQESLAYTGQFLRPPLELWGAGGTVIRHLTEALEPYKVTLDNFQLNPSMASAADTVFTVRLGSTVLKFSFTKIEVGFSGFSETEFQGIPLFLNAATGWLTREPYAVKYASHQVQYFSHSFLSGAGVEDFLREVNPKSISSEGLNLGGGAIFHHLLPDRQWRTQLTIDRSTVVPGALFVGLLIQIQNSDIGYESLLAQGREFFVKAIGEFGLIVPEPSPEK